MAEERTDRADQEPEYRELDAFEEAEVGDEGVSGEGESARGTTPGSVGGTTGTSGHAAGTQTPGATEPPVRGIDPDEAREKMKRRHSSRSRWRTDEAEP